MEKQWNIDDFTITIGRPSIGVIKEKKRIRIVIVPYTVRNNSNEMKKFSSERYDYIIKSDVIKKDIKKDFIFEDSLVNQDIMPHSVSKGYIRIPFKGNGMYGIVLKTLDKYISTKQVVWRIEPNSKKEVKTPPLKIKKNNIQKKQDIDCISSLILYKKYRPVCSLHSRKLDEQDEFIIRETTRSEVFGGGRKKSLEWNRRAALKRYSSKRNKKKKKLSSSC